MHALNRLVLKKIEELRPGIFVPKGAIFVAEMKKQYKITIYRKR